MVSTNRDRNITIDIAKGICIILVVIGHYVPENAPGWYIDLITCIYTFHMPLFLFASGYIYALTKRKESYISFIKRKCKRLMLPYIVTSIIIISFKLFSSGVARLDHSVTGTAYIEMFYSPAAGYFLWFIWTLMTMFLIVPFLSSKTARVIGFVAFFILSVLHPYIKFPDIFCIPQTAAMGAYFLAGVIALDYKKQLNISINTNYILSAFIFIILESLAVYFHGSNDIEYRLYLLIVAYYGILFVVKSSKMILRFGKVKYTLLAVSGCSYMIYLFHTLFEGIVKACIYKFLPLSATIQFFIPIALLAITMGVICPMILQNIIKRNKYTSLLFGMKFNDKVD